ncbi:MAG: SLBB domain-containing protein [Oscillospiraceae bacterium]|nr:SLBB domain-containing protein [Oscillospiraceae bacterium]
MNLIERVFEAGIVGCGGAGFPTHIKLSAEAQTFIVNGAECEPLLFTDRHLMRTQAMNLIRAAQAIGSHVGAADIFIALKRTYEREIRELESVIGQENSAVKLFLLDNFYPAGDEQAIVLEVTGKSVPPGGIPPDLGAVVSNVATVLAVGRALEGKPFTHRVLTVTGEVNSPTLLRVPVGTSLNECIEQAGGTRLRDYSIVAGGPLMGRLLSGEEAGRKVVTKTTSGLIVLPSESPLVARGEVSVAHTVNRARSVCIQCSYCTQLCPRYLSGHPLQPHKIMRALAFGGDIGSILAENHVREALICCECGICEDYACPMQLQPRKINALIKVEYAKAGERYSKCNRSPVPMAEREERKIYPKRIAARLGLLAYYEREIWDIADYCPGRVEIPLKQHIGRPAEPIVKVGDRVSMGEKIALCPRDELGANVHASIDGRVIEVGQSVVIESEVKSL